MSRKLKVETQFHRQTQIGCNKIIWLAVLDTSSPGLFAWEHKRGSEGCLPAQAVCFHGTIQIMRCIEYSTPWGLTSSPPVNMRNINRSSDYQNPISAYKTKLVKNLLSLEIAWNLVSSTQIITQLELEFPGDCSNRYRAFPPSLIWSGIC